MESDNGIEETLKETRYATIDRQRGLIEFTHISPVDAPYLTDVEVRERFKQILEKPIE